MKRVVVLALVLTMATQSGCVQAFRIVGPLLFKSGLVTKKAVAVAGGAVALHGDDVARKIFPKAASVADDTARTATKRLTNTKALSAPASQAARVASKAAVNPALSQPKNALAVARAASSQTRRVVEKIPPSVPIRGALYLTRRYEKNQAALDAMNESLQQTGLSDREYERAQQRVEKITAEQAAIARLIEKMG